MSYKKTLEHLYSMDSPNIKLGLENIKTLLQKIGNPEKGLKCVHVAGTNGKGSVCAMIFHILMEAGYKVGLYTSPHLKRFNERIRINGHFISDSEVASHFLKMKPCITSQSFFEITTAMAFLYFNENCVDYAVLETGLGGRLDATNVVVPLVSVITNIGLEHTDILGSTIEKIAFEKAGIIKRNVPAVTGAKGRALSVIKKIAKARNAAFYDIKNIKKFAGIGFRRIKFDYLNGEFQQENAKIALAAINILRKIYSTRIKLSHIQKGIKKTKWPGRLQFISKNVLIDCAHNPEGFEALKKELAAIKSKKNIGSFIFVVGMQKTKDIKGMLKKIAPLILKIIFTKSSSKKATEPSELFEVYKKISSKRNSFSKNFFAKSISNPKKALRYAKKIAGKRDLVVVTGSIYMVGEAI